MFEFILFFFLLSFISFTFMKLAPGDPVRYMLNVIDVQTSNEQIEDLREELGFNDPIHVQYGSWLLRFAQLDLGYSYMTNKPVFDELAARVPSTLALTASSLLVMTSIAVPVGTLAAVYKHT